MIGKDVEVRHKYVVGDRVRNDCSQDGLVNLNNYIQMASECTFRLRMDKHRTQTTKTLPILNLTVFILSDQN